MINNPLARTNNHPYGITIEKASGATLWTKEFGTMLDFSCGIGVNNLGHRYSDIETAIVEQSRKYLHTMVYGEFEQTPVNEYAQELADEFSRPTRKNGVGDVGDVKVWFCTSGTEANELAMKLATLYTGRRKFMAVHGGFHGRTAGSLALTYRPEYREPFKEWMAEGLCDWVTDGSELSDSDEKRAAFFMEFIRGEDGVREVSLDMAERIQEWCRETGTLLVIDEVQTGFSRTGDLFALDHYKSINPDIVVLGKALGGGLPLGAVIARSEIFDTIEKGFPFTHLSTFGGNPLSCVAGQQMLLGAKRFILDLDEGETRARQDDIFEPLTGLPVTVRGRGFMYGLDLHEGLSPDRVVQMIWRQGVFVGRVLHDHSTLRFYPPVNMAQGDIRDGVRRIAKAIQLEAG